MLNRFSILISLIALIGCGGQTPESNDPTDVPKVDLGGDDDPPIRPVNSLAAHLPARSNDDGYVSSTSCKSCHKREYETWHGSFHRTMTQVATPESVLGNFDDVTLSWNLPTPAPAPPGQSPVVRHEYRLEKRGDEFWVRTKIIDAAGRAHDGGENQIVMTTGSHHYQIYWASPGPDRMLVIFPFVYLKEAKRWVTRESALVAPPSSHQKELYWNAICMRCHSTHGQPRVDVRNRIADTRVAELGISCEACHGSGEQHVAARRRGEKGPAMVHPEKLSAQRSSQLCGQCHAIVTFGERDWDKGFWNRVKPGDDLHENRNVVQFGHPDSLEEVHRQYKEQFRDEKIVERVFEQFKRDRFWSDGTLRTTGREYNSISQTKCYEGGKLSCLSCHSMHNNEGPDDQLGVGMRGDAACIQCHKEDKYAKDIESHTHHPVESSGSRCNNCHMPHTSYGLLKAIRSHDINSPSIKNTIETGRPIACNQCHLDKTLAWTQQQLTKWNPQTPQVKLSDDQKNISATVIWLTKGEAGQRALAAWTMGWDEAKKVSGDDWLAPHLGLLLDDPYTAVRYVAARSLRRLEGFKDFEFDFVADPQTLTKARHLAIETWKESSREPNKAALIKSGGELDIDAITRLMKERDNRPVNLAE